jgi:3'-5' exoribonuclease
MPMPFGEKLQIGTPAKAPHKFINQIEAGQPVDDIYLFSQAILRSTTRGDLYIAMFLSDKTGKLNCRMWQATEAIFNSLPREGFVHIKGRSELYQNNLQIVADTITVVPTEKVNLEDYLARTTKDVNAMFEQVKNILGAVKDPQIKVLIGAFLADEPLMQKFRNAPAAVNCHHNYLGGLLEHTCNMLQSAKAILPLYPQVQADLVLAGIFLHDMGKTEELSYDMAFSYTDSGQLVGHIVQTAVMLNKKADQLAQKGIVIPKPIMDNLEHIIVSHHGEYEFGSPKLPATAEAFMVNYIDDLDAKIEQVTAAIETETGDEGWTPFKPTLQTRLYRKRVTQ